MTFLDVWIAVFSLQMYFSIYVRQKYAIMVSFRERETPDYKRTDNKAKKPQNSTKK